MSKCSYSNVCTLCGEEVVWSIVEHLLDKHKDVPEVKELQKMVNALWAKFVVGKGGCTGESV